MGRGRSIEPAIVRQRLARLAAGSPSPVESPVVEPSALEPPTVERLALSPEAPGVATPRWLDPTGWESNEPQVVGEAGLADRFSLDDLVDSEDSNSKAVNRHRLVPTPPAAVALVVVGVAAALIAAYLALRAPSELVPVVDFPASAGPIASDSAGPTSIGAGQSPAGPSASPSTRIVISVVGLVRHPGLVRLPPQSRVADAVAAAGGARPGADLVSLNLARPLRDGDQIVVGLSDAPGRAGLRSAIIGVDGVASGPAATNAPRATDGGASPEGKVDLNTATAEQLDALPGVGPVTAKAIVDWRSTHGGFTSVDQLAEVDGIGPTRLQRLRALVTVGGR